MWYLDAFHLHLDALDVAKHAQHVAESGENTSLLLEQVHQLPPLRHNLVLARLHAIFRVVVLLLQLT